MVNHLRAYRLSLFGTGWGLLEALLIAHSIIKESHLVEDGYSRNIPYEAFIRLVMTIPML